jgi:DNA modification methylase
MTNFTIHNANAWKAVAELEDNSIGSLVTDPPYLINFMGNDWDKLDDNIAGNKEFWELVLSKMKHGAHGVIFGHSRTHHRVMIALEDAGFEIRDTIMWLYGQGFPKNHDIGKAVDKIQGNKREVVGTKADFSLDGAQRKSDNHKSLQETINSTQTYGYKKGWNAEVSVGSSAWEGWGTALKPAYEPIILVRKPLKKGLSIAKNCLSEGVGGINIDESRVGEGDTGRFPANIILSHHPDCKQVGTTEETVIGGNKGTSGFANGYESGDFTKETKSVAVWECVDDCPCRILDEQAPEVGSAFKAIRKKATSGGTGDSWTNGGKKVGEDNGLYDGLAGASRFFYQAKASKTERNFGADNKHPTVKPVSLMYYLVRLITPEGETCLDPFLGSGATGMACMLLDRPFVGIELDEDWAKVSEGRIAYTRDNLDKAKKVFKIKE